MRAVLDGIRVIDFGRYIAGPYCTGLLADLGATVIRVEKSSGGEDRFIAPLEDGTGAGYLQVNRGKRCLTLDPSTPQGKEIVRKLILSADVVSTNFPPTVQKKFGLDYAALRQIKEDIILVSTTAFGDSGPYRDRVGFDGIAQAMCGSVYLAGTEEQPQRGIAAHVDYSTALSGLAGTLAALMEKQKSGKGQHVQVDLLRTALTIMNPQLIEQSATQINRIATGNRGQLSAPTDIYKCTDGWVILQVVGQPLFERWARMVGVEEWIEDERFKSDILRGQNGQVISDKMSLWCSARSVVEVIDSCETVRIPCAPVYSPQQTLNDPHVQQAGYFEQMPYPGLSKEVPIAKAPFKLSHSPVRIQSRAPTLSEHTEEILSEIGYSTAEIDTLRQQKVI